MNRLLLNILLLLCLTQSLMAVESKIMILNSSSDVLKYRQMSRRLESRFDNNVQFDLNEKRINESVLESKVTDYNPDVILTIGAEAAEVASRVAPDKPRLFLQTLAWNKLGATHNLYGIENTVSVGYQLSSFKYFFPTLKSVTVFYNPEYNSSVVDEAKMAAKRSNIDLKPISVRSVDQLNEFLDNDLIKTEAVWIIPDPVALSSVGMVKRLFNYAEDKHVPVFAYDPSFVKYGASLVLGVENQTVVNQAVQMSKHIVSNDFRGSKIKPPAGTHVIMNVKQLRKLGVAYNEFSLSSVNEVIE